MKKLQEDLTKENPAIRINLLKSILSVIDQDNPDLESNHQTQSRDIPSTAQTTNQDEKINQVLIYHQKTRELLDQSDAIAGLSKEMKSEFFEIQLTIAKMIRNSEGDGTSRDGQINDFFKNFLYLIPNSENKKRFINTLSGPHNFELPNGEFSLQSVGSEEEFLQVLIGSRTNAPAAESVNYLSILQQKFNFEQIMKGSSYPESINGQEGEIERWNETSLMSDVQLSNILKAIYLNMVYVANVKQPEELRTYFDQLQQLEIKEKVGNLLQSNEELAGLRTRILDSCGLLPSNAVRHESAVALGTTGQHAARLQ